MPVTSRLRRIGKITALLDEIARRGSLAAADFAGSADRVAAHCRRVERVALRPHGGNPASSSAVKNC